MKGMSNQSQISQSISDAYFTPYESVSWCQKILRERNWLDSTTIILEPCVGAGALVYGLCNEVIAGDLIHHGYPNTIVEDYLLARERSVNLVFTNPPFGRMGSLAIQFLNKAARDSDRLAFILPSSFRKISILDKIHPFLHPVFDEDLPNQNYLLPDGSIRWVNTCFQLWERRTVPRRIFKKIIHYSHYTRRVRPRDAEFAFRTQGASAGRVLSGLNYNPASTAFLIGGRERIEKHDWTKIASFTAGIPAIGLNDVALGLFLEEEGKSIDDYLMKGAISVLM
jgi:hypothetical protein